ncbi:hypothetical protein [Oceanobacillus sp. Castelsardo]|uniref:hypothetical protein n=1 Tax=Oceanobacillus sp. Castelsardo TaxID=1851204 RepID=UPI000839A891|nr:hypothetical protein [Oceanobacillus sp. Castelsardo]
MEEKVIYLLFTNTGTLLARVIRLFTGQSLNHVSICFDHKLMEVYSFGRKKVRNPFIGGFVKEDVRCGFLRKSECEIYQFTIEDLEYNRILERIREVEARKDAYKYNFLGLFGVLFQLELKRRNAFFCSQFIATLLNEVKQIQFSKSICFVKPEDIRKLEGLQLIYKGILESYYKEEIEEEKQLQRSFLPFYLSKKLKHFKIAKG